MEIVLITEDKVKIAPKRLRLALERQNKYTDQRYRPKTFDVGEKVMLKVSPWKVIILFGKQGKVDP